MLVLNTNNQENTGGLYSNHMLKNGACPDFNSILIHPTISQSTTITKDHAFGNNAIINGLGVDDVDGTLWNQNVLNGNNAGGDVGSQVLYSNVGQFGVGTGTSTTDIDINLRYATIGKLEAGALIGKYFFFPLTTNYILRVSTSRSDNTIKAGTNLIDEYRRGFIHADGTKTMIGSVSDVLAPTSDLVIGTQNYLWWTGTVGGGNHGVVIGTSNGAISQEGDSVYVEHILHGTLIFSHSYSGSPTIYPIYRIDFGKKGSISNEYQPRPFQISID